MVPRHSWWICSIHLGANPRSVKSNFLSIKMNTLNYLKRQRTACKTRVPALIALLCMITLFGVSEMSAAESSAQFTLGNDTLIVYKDVPGHVPSEFYTIRVRSAATHNEWVECFANITRSLHDRLPANVPIIKNKREHYYTYLRACLRMPQHFVNVNLYFVPQPVTHWGCDTHLT